MAASEDQDTAERLEMALGVYVRVVAGLMMVLGLRQWAIIVGAMAGPAGMFADMSTTWKIATAHLAVVDLVASVGLWQRTAWGTVVWIYAALAEIAMHTVFMSTFGQDIVMVAIHVVALIGFGALLLLHQRAIRRQ